MEPLALWPTTARAARSPLSVTPQPSFPLLIAVGRLRISKPIISNSPSQPLPITGAGMPTAIWVNVPDVSPIWKAPFGPAGLTENPMLVEMTPPPEALFVPRHCFPSESVFLVLTGRSVAPRSARRRLPVSDSLVRWCLAERRCP
jgi:hypothetical protein